MAGVNCHSCKRISVLQLLDELFRGNKCPVRSQKGFTVQHQICRERQQRLSQCCFQKKEASCKVESSLTGRGHGHILTQTDCTEMLCCCFLPADGPYGTRVKLQSNCPVPAGLAPICSTQAYVTTKRVSKKHLFVGQELSILGQRKMWFRPWGYFKKEDLMVKGGCLFSAFTAQAAQSPAERHGHSSPGKSDRSGTHVF